MGDTSFGLLAAVCIAAWIAPYPAATAPAPVDPKVERASSRMTLFSPRKV
jgi:hypothetical protein